MNNTSEQESIIIALKSGNEKAIREIYESMYPYCASFILKNNGSGSEARDVFHDALLILYRNIRQADFVLSSTLKTYLFSIVRHLWLQELEKKKRRNTLMVDTGFEFIELPDTSLVNHREIEQKYKVVFEQLEILGEACRKVLSLFYIKNKSLREIAKKMEYSEKFTKVKKMRCMKELKKRIKEQHKNNLS